MLHSTRKRNLQMGRLHLDGYKFDHEWEIVPGVWILEVWHKKRKLLTQSFNVSEPESTRACEPTPTHTVDLGG